MRVPKHNQIPTAVVRIVCAVLILCAAALVMHQRTAKRDEGQYDIQKIDPTCTKSGYSLYTDLNTGEVYVQDIIDATGHDFGPWVLSQNILGINCGFSTRICSVCGQEEMKAEYPELGISRISLYGSLDGIGKKTEVPLTAHLELKEDDLSIDCYASLKYQGHVSLSYDKKNYTLKLFNDEARQEKNKLTLSHWNKENKYILKANYVDTSQCRNLVCADVWADICAARSNIPPQFKDLSNYGAIDGLPVALYINDQFWGLYNMNLHKDDDLFCMEEDAQHAILISNNSAMPEASFREQAVFTENSPWEVEFCGTEDSTWAKEKLNALIEFVMNSDDKTFRTELSQYLDINAAIDYLIAMYALGLTNHGNQDLVLVSYGDIWIPSMYDMETAFGLQEGGADWHEYKAFLPVKEGNTWLSGTDNLLWDRLLQNFFPEIRARYQELRADILDPQNLCKRVNTFMETIPAELYDAEQERNPHPRSYVEHNKQMTTYIVERIEALDLLLL